MSREGMHRGLIVVAAERIDLTDPAVDLACTGPLLVVRESLAGGVTRHWMLCSECDTVVKL